MNDVSFTNIRSLLVAVAKALNLINPALETLYLRSDDPAISSSMIRELLAFGKPVDRYVPDQVRRVIEGA